MLKIIPRIPKKLHDENDYAALAKDAEDHMISRMKLTAVVNVWKKRPIRHEREDL